MDAKKSSIADIIEEYNILKKREAQLLSILKYVSPYEGIGDGKREEADKLLKSIYCDVFDFNDGE